MTGFEPATTRSQSECTTGLCYIHIYSWRRSESNRQHIDCKSTSLSLRTCAPLNFAARMGFEPMFSYVTGRHPLQTGPTSYFLCQRKTRIFLGIRVFFYLKTLLIFKLKTPTTYLVHRHSHLHTQGHLCSYF